MPGIGVVGMTVGFVEIMAIVSDDIIDVDGSGVERVVVSILEDVTDVVVLVVVDCVLAVVDCVGAVDRLVAAVIGCELAGVVVGVIVDVVVRRDVVVVLSGREEPGVKTNRMVGVVIGCILHDTVTMAQCYRASVYISRKSRPFELRPSIYEK